jgi:UDP-N-acetylglucosamine transferase subunit ALG13
MQQKEAVCILLAPLNWGLGHATRCIPIINELVNQGARVLIAATGPQLTLLKQEFPRLEFIKIPSYQIRYKPGFLLKWGLILRIPAILKQIKREHVWLAQCLRHHKIDAVISDNRYGLYHKNLFCVFITHQLYIQSGVGSFNKVGSWQLTIDGWINRILLHWNYKFIRKFSCCWVPDQEGIFSIAGKLSHPPVLPPVPLKFIGILSRFKLVEKEFVKNSLLILLSGPEPHRTLFENILFRQLTSCTLKTVVVRGLPDGDTPVPFLKGIEIYNHLPSDKLNELLKTSEFIIARSGYSTAMDLVQVKKNAILIPTPGQTEQEYLGRYLHEKKWMYTVSQKDFNLEKVIYAFQESKMELPEIMDSLVQNAVEDFLEVVLKNKSVNR